MRSCPRWVKTAETKQFESEDTIYPKSITEAQMAELPKHIGETYEECAGEVDVLALRDTHQLPAPCGMEKTK